MRAHDKKTMVGQWRRRDGALVQFILGYSHFIGAPRDVVVTPFDDDSVAALVLDSVGDVIELVAHVFDIDLLTRSMGSVHAYHEHVCA